jgi:hypothetical protein
MDNELYTLAMDAKEKEIAAWLSGILDAAEREAADASERSHRRLR